MSIMSPIKVKFLPCRLNQKYQYPSKLQNQMSFLLFLHLNLPTYLLPYLPTFLLKCLLPLPLPHLLACLPTCLPPLLLPHLPACLLTRLLPRPLPHLPACLTISLVSRPSYQPVVYQRFYVNNNKLRLFC